MSPVCKLYRNGDTAVRECDSGAAPGGFLLNGSDGHMQAATAQEVPGGGGLCLRGTQVWTRRREIWVRGPALPLPTCGALGFLLGEGQGQQERKVPVSVNGCAVPAVPASNSHPAGESCQEGSAAVAPGGRCGELICLPRPGKAVLF